MQSIYDIMFKQDLAHFKIMGGGCSRSDSQGTAENRYALTNVEIL